MGDCTDMRRRWLVASVAVLIIMVGLTLGTGMWARHQRTAPHEFTLPDPLQVDVAEGITATLKNCFALTRRPSLEVRALAPSAQLSFVSSLSDPAQFEVLLSNIDCTRALVTGATSRQVDGKPGTLALTVDLPAGGSVNVKVEPSTAPEKFSFYVYGDNHGQYDVLAQMMTTAAKERPLLVVGLGDTLRDGDTEKELEDALRGHLGFMSRGGVPYVSVLGDAETNDTTYNANAHIRLAGPTYYRFSHGNSLFVVLDNARGYISGAQLAWLRHVLATEGGQFTHVFAFAHQAVFDPRRGRYHCMKPFMSGAGELQSILEKTGVEIFFTGHLHDYLVTETNGVKYVTSGGAGAAINKPTPANHYLAVTVDGDHADIDVRWLLRAAPQDANGLIAP